MDLVTGGAGFVGSWLVERLVAEGRRVRVLDAVVEQPADPADRLRRNAAAWRRRPEIDLVEADVRDADRVERALEGVGRVFHLAARTGARRSVEQAREVLDTNAGGTAFLLDAMERRGVRRLVLASSAAVYGESRGLSSEDDVPAPLSPYGASKLAAEGLAHAWAASGAGRAAVIRLATVYGDRQRPDMAVSRFLHAIAQGHDLPIFGTTASVRDYLHVSDAVSALVRAAHGEEPWLLLNAATGVGTSLQDLLRALRRTTGREHRVAMIGSQAGDPERVVLDPDRAGRRLGWRARVPLDEGLTLRGPGA